MITLKNIEQIKKLTIVTYQQKDLQIIQILFLYILEF